MRSANPIALAFIVAAFMVITSIVIAVDMVLASKQEPIGVVPSPTPVNQIYK